MIYLDEDAVNFQIHNCQQIESEKGIICDRCGKRKSREQICPLGEAWISDRGEDKNLELIAIN